MARPNKYSTRNSAALLEEMGVQILGPRSGVLSNGRRGVGMMEEIDVATSSSRRCVTKEALVGACARSQ